MAAPIRFLSGRQQQQKIGIEGSTDNQKVLEVVGRVGIGTTVFEPSGQLEVRGDASVSGVLTTGSLNVTGSSSVPATLTVESLNATGVSTFGGAVDINAGLDVDGQSDLDEVVVAGVATFSNAVDINSTLDVDGDTQLDDLNVAGVSTFSSAVNATAAVNATDIIKGYKYTAVPYGSTVTLAVTVASKDSTHRYNGTGSGNGYVIDGIQAPFLTLTPGRTYRFTNDNTGSHPLKFYLEADKTTLYETNVNFQDAYTEITVTDETPIVLHYQCTAHGFMGNAVQTNANVVNTNYPATIRSTLDVSGVSTFTQLDVSTGGLDVDGLTNLDEVIVAGVSTFTGNIVAATAEFSGNVTIGGTLTSENKTNIDSVGLVTARTGVRVIAGGIDVTAGVSTFGGAVNFNDSVGVVGGLTADSLTISGVTTGINAAGISSFVRIDVDGQADLDEVVIAGVATFQGAVNFDVNSEINIGTGVTILGNNLHVTGIVSALKFIGDGSGITNLPGINTIGSSNLTDVNVSGTTTTVQLRISGIGTAEKFFVSTGGFEVDGQSDLDELVVAGVSTFNANTFINADLSVTGDIGASGIITATGIQLVAGSGLDVGAVGVLTALSVDVSTGGIDVDGQATLDEVVVAGVATFSALADVNNRLDVAGGANIDQLNVAGIASFTQLDVSTGGIDVDGQATLDELVVAGVSTFTGTVKIDGALDIGVAGVDVEGLTNLDELIVAGVSTFSSTINGNVTGNLTGTASDASGATSDFSIADKIVHTGDTNTALRFPAADTFTVETGGSERVRVNSDGKLLLGATSLVENNNYGPNISFQVSSDVTGVINAISYSNSFNGAIEIMRAKGTAASPTNVVDTTELGNVNFYGYNSNGASGDKFQLAAEVGAIVDGTPGSGSQDMPGALIFRTATASTGQPLERARVSSAGNVGINSTVPSEKLDVLGNVKATSFIGDLTGTASDASGATSDFSIADKIIHTGDTNTAIRFPAADTFSVETAGSERVRIDSGGAVNIGDVWADDSDPMVYISKNSDVGNLILKGNGTGTNNAFAIYGGGWSGSTDNKFAIRADGSVWGGQTSLRFGTGSTYAERLRITSAGNFNFLGNLVNVNATGVSSFVQLDVSTGGLDVDGQTDLDELVVAGVSTFSANAIFNNRVAVGTDATPSFPLDVQDTIQIRKNGGNNLAILQFNASSTKLHYSDATGHLSFYTNSTERGYWGYGGGLNVTSGGLNVTSGAVDISTGGLDVDGQTDLDELQVAGVSTFSAKAVFNTAYPSIDADNEIQVGTAIQLGKAGVITATSFSGSGANLTGIAATDHVSTFDLVVAGISTFNDDVRILAGGINVSGVGTFAGLKSNDTLTVSGITNLNNDVIFDGASYNASWDKSANTLNLSDNAKATFGTGNDLEIYHDGSNSYINITGSGNLLIGADTAGVSGIITATGINVVAGSGLHAGNTGVVTAVGAEFNGTSHIKLPAGSTGQRPGSPTAGDLRYNSDDGAFEGYTDSWGAIGGGTPEVDTNVSSTSAVGVGSFATASFRSAEVVAQIVQIDEYQVGKYLMIHDGTTVTVIEQAAVSTGDAMIGSFDGAINGSNAELRVTMVSSGIATVTTKISTVTV